MRGERSTVLEDDNRCGDHICIEVEMWTVLGFDSRSSTAL